MLDDFRDMDDRYIKYLENGIKNAMEEINKLPKTTTNRGKMRETLVSFDDVRNILKNLID